MGRKKKYLTIEEQRTAQRKYVRTYYERNKERINNATMKKYYEHKRNNLQDNKPD